MFNFKKAVSVAVMLTLAFTVAGCSTNTVAVVNGEKITKTELKRSLDIKKIALEQQGAKFTGEQGEMMVKALEQQTLEELIQQKILFQAAKKESVLPTKAEVNKELEAIKTQFGGAKAFEDALKQFKYTNKDIEEKLTFDIAYQKLFEKVTKDIKVTEKEAKTYYDQNKAMIKAPAKIKARAILIKFDDPNQQAMNGQPPAKVGRNEQEAEKLAKDIISQLNDGASFEKLAKEKSEDERFKKDGGLIKDTKGNAPYEKSTVMPQEFDQAAEALKAGKYTEKPVKTPQGFYIIKLESLTPEKQLTFDEAKKRIIEDLPMVRKQEKFNEYFTKLEKSAKVENKLAKKATEENKKNGQETGQDSTSGGGQLPPGHP